MTVVTDPLGVPASVYALTRPSVFIIVRGLRKVKPVDGLPDEENAMPEPITLIGFGGGFVVVITHLARRYFDTAKEVLDIVAAAILLVLCLPLLGVCAMIVKLSSKGPVILVQMRMGKDGKAFPLYKIRTMYRDAESCTGAKWASQDDPRIVPSCRWMRRTHVDELPQLINVIKGEMSLVGPRPERPEILAELEQVYPTVNRRLSIRPGITGLAQVRKGYDTTVEAFRRKLEDDLEYIAKRNWSLELSILAKTLTKLHDKSAH